MMENKNKNEIIERENNNSMHKQSIYFQMNGRKWFSIPNLYSVINCTYFYSKQSARWSLKPIKQSIYNSHPFIDDLVATQNELNEKRHLN